jgi:hypothetical protein
MRVTGWPSYWEPSEGLLPVDIQDVDIQDVDTRGTPSELRSLAQFLVRAADELESAQRIHERYRSSSDFRDDKPQAQTPIVFEVIDDESAAAR